VSALEISVPFEGEQGTNVLLGFDISAGDPTRVDLYLNPYLSDSESQKTYSVAKNVVVGPNDPTVRKVIPRVIAPNLCVPFSATVRRLYSLTSLNSIYQFVASNDLNSRKTYPVDKNVVVDPTNPVVPEVIPRVDTPNLCVLFFATVRPVYSLTSLTSFYQFVATKVGYVLPAFLSLSESLTSIVDNTLLVVGIPSTLMMYMRVATLS
jgi:hypothetical protein